MKTQRSPPFTFTVPGCCQLAPKLKNNTQLSPPHVNIMLGIQAREFVRGGEKVNHLSTNDIMFILKILRNPKTLSQVTYRLSKAEGQKILVQNSIVLLKLAVNNRNKTNETIPCMRVCTHTHTKKETHKKQLTLCTENYRA